MQSAFSVSCNVCPLPNKYIDYLNAKTNLQKALSYSRQSRKALRLQAAERTRSQAEQAWLCKIDGQNWTRALEPRPICNPCESIFDTLSEANNFCWDLTMRKPRTLNKLSSERSWDGLYDTRFSPLSPRRTPMWRIDYCVFAIGVVLFFKKR